VDDHTLVAEGYVAWRCPFAAGDPVEIRHGDFSPAGFTGTLKNVAVDDKRGEATLTFDRALPDRIDSDSILFNHRYGSRNVIIRNCYFHENRARGVLCNTADWLVEGNRFFHNQHAAMRLLADVGPSWSEGFGATDVTVRNNTFASANSEGATEGAVVEMSATSNGGITHYPLLQDIVLEDNVFREMTGFAVEARSFHDVVIQNNQIVNQEAAPIALRTRGSIRAEFGDGLWLEGNAWTTKAGLPTPDLSYDPETVKNVVCRGNRLGR
jgi:hypothetical protein